MAELNPNPYKDGDPLGPTGRITAIFGSLKDLNEAIPELETLNYRGDDLAIFVGKQAEINLDAKGQFRDIVGLKLFQNAVCDEMEMYEQFQKALETGGAVVAVRTGDDEPKKVKVVDVLKSHNARKVNYWGTWTNDALA